MYFTTELLNILIYLLIDFTVTVKKIKYADITYNYFNQNGQSDVR